MEKDRERLLYLDLLRILATAFVVMLHSMGYYIDSAAMYGTRTWYVCILLNALVRTGVPLFFMMSGFLLLSDARTASFSDFYRRRLPRVLLPFITWDVVYFLYYRIAGGKTIDLRDFFTELFSNGSAYHLWFVYTLGAMYLIAPFLRMLVERCTPRQMSWLWLLVIFTGTIRPFINTVFNVHIFLFDPLMEGYLGYFLLGYLLGSCELPKAARAAIYLGGAAGCVYGIYVNLSGASPEGIPLAANGGYAINQFLFAAAIFTLFKYLPPVKNRVAASCVTAVSGVTYGVYLSHALVLEIIRHGQRDLTPAQDIILCFAVALIIPVVLLLPLSMVKVIRKYIM